MFWRKDPGRLITYFTFPPWITIFLQSTQTALCVYVHSIYTTKCALYLNYKLYWRKQFIAYSKKAKSFWQMYESVGKIVDKFLMYFFFGENEQCGLICKHASFWQPAKGKEAAQHLAKLCENQNLNKNSMKHVQQHHFLFKTANRVTEMFPKTLCLFACFSFFFLAGLA